MVALRVNFLVEINPQYAGEKSDSRSEWQEQNGGPEDDSRNPPASQNPQEQGDWCHDQDTQAVTEVHGAEKVAGFTLKLEVTYGTALAHFWESPEDGIAEDSANEAAGAALFENAAKR